MEGARTPPTSLNDSLVVFLAGVCVAFEVRTWAFEVGREGEPSNESIRPVGGRVEVGRRREPSNESY